MDNQDSKVSNLALSLATGSRVKLQQTAKLAIEKLNCSQSEIVVICVEGRPSWWQFITKCDPSALPKLIEYLCKGQRLTY